MNIGAAANVSGLTAKMIRYYERIELVPASRRTRSGYRDYLERDVQVIGAGIFLLAAYVLFPAFQTWIAANALIFLLLLCPLSMLFCMRGMHKGPPASDDTQKVKPIERDPTDAP
ncbi:MerR family DNA-binding transcriptional regulator [Pseudomonas aeruginosa]|nr:MerR family DNA-binding transcriptional regulator [Pseudomonas aeruginosa]